MTSPSHPIRVSIEATPKKAFATAVDWPGWSRSGKTSELALESLARYAVRYAPVARLAGQAKAFGTPTPDDFKVVERVPGDTLTEFGVPGDVTDEDRRPLSAKEAERLARLVEASWALFDGVVQSAPAELRRGPRGGGRDTAKIIDHVAGADEAYAREMGIRAKGAGSAGDGEASALRSAITAMLRRPSDGSPLAARRWTPRYAARRSAWHALDHAWEIEDRTEPASEGGPAGA